MAGSRRLTNRVRMGRASRRRIRAGGPLALGRPAASLEQWQEIRAQVLARARWACQACSVRTRLDVHHVTKRTQGGSDFGLDRLIALCRDCHAQTDAPFRQGRLVITPLGEGRFHCEVMRGASKWAVQGAGGNVASATYGTRPPLR
jgi:5-methylcytosine-specific restriction endonuclease McrA